MERIYLVTALAIIATFAGFSRGFQSLQRISQQHGQVTSTPQCGALPSIVSRVLARLKNDLHPTDPEEAQLLAELNLPLAAMQAKVAEQAAKQSQAAAEIARETAMRDVERARRDAMKMREEIARGNMAVAPISIDLHGLDGLDRRVQIKAAAVAERMAARSMRMQMAAARMQAVSMQWDNSGKRHSPCGARRAELQ